MVASAAREGRTKGTNEKHIVHCIRGTVILKFLVAHKSGDESSVEKVQSWKHKIWK